MWSLSKAKPLYKSLGPPSAATWLLTSVQVWPLSVVRSNSALRLWSPTAQPCWPSGAKNTSLTSTESRLAKAAGRVDNAQVEVAPCEALAEYAMYAVPVCESPEPPKAMQ